MQKLHFTVYPRQLLIAYQILTVVKFFKTEENRTGSLYGTEGFE